MLAALQAHALVQTFHKLRPLEEKIDAKLKAWAEAGWPSAFVLRPEDWRDVNPDEFTILMQRYRVHGWTVTVAETIHAGKSHHEVIFEHPSKQFERGGPGDR